MPNARNLARVIVDSSGDIAANNLDNAIPADGSITSAKLASTLDLSSKSLTLPAGKGFDVSSSSNPAYNTNPAGGVGTVWKNTSTGEIFVCTQATTNTNIWKGTRGTTVAAELVLYDKTNGNNIDIASWASTSQVAASSHNWGNDGNGLYAYCVGSGSTWMGVFTWVYTTGAIAIPSYANTMEVTAYIQVKDSNQQDTGGSIIYSLGTTANSGNTVDWAADSTIGTQDDVTLTFNIPCSVAAGTNQYFRTYGGGGQYANVIWTTKKIRFIP